MEEGNRHHFITQLLILFSYIPSHLLLPIREPYQASIWMSCNVQTWKFKCVLLHEEPCWAQRLKTVKLFLTSDETKNSQGWIIFFLFWKKMTSHEYQGFNIVLAHAREEAKNEVRSKVFIYEPLKCTWSIYIVHVVNINTSFFCELVLCYIDLHSIDLHSTSTLN